MPKKDPTNPEPDAAQTNGQATNQSHTEVHVETHSQQHATAGASDDQRVAGLTADLQRLQAEFINYKRRAEAERAEVIDFAKNRVVREFLTVRDSFDSELAHRPADVKPEWAVSIDAIRTQFDKVLKTLGVERFESKGRPFDPHLHEAIAIEDGAGAHEVVVEELQSGYKLGPTILRHAVVKVGKTDQTPGAPASPKPTPPQPTSNPDANGQVK
jgi:molecular chaperone GrpE